MSEDTLEIIDPHESEDYFQALTYVTMHEIVTPRIALPDVAAHLCISQSTLRRRINAWTNNGLLKAIRKQIVAPHQVEQILLAQSELLGTVPAQLQRLAKIATSSKSDHVASETTQWIWTQMVQPLLDNQVDSGSEETAYMKRLEDGAQAIDPFAIIEALPISKDETN